MPTFFNKLFLSFRIYQLANFAIIFKQINFLKIAYKIDQRMLRKLGDLFGKKAKPLLIRVRKGREETIIECKAGDNLMDITNSIVNQDVNIFGLCDKQLACTTCRVDVQSHFNQLPPPTEEQLDVLLTTKNYRDFSSRMACQIFVTEELNGMVIRIQPQSITKKS